MLAKLQAALWHLQGKSLKVSALAHGVSQWQVRRGVEHWARYPRLLEWALAGNEELATRALKHQTALEENQA